MATTRIATMPTSHPHYRQHTALPMTASNFSSSSSRTTAASNAKSTTNNRERVVQLWRDFHDTTVQKDRKTLQHRINAEIQTLERDQARRTEAAASGNPGTTLPPLSEDQLDLSREKVMRSLRLANYEKARREWERRLEAAKLSMDDWRDMTEAEQKEYRDALGDDEDEDEESGEDDEDEGAVDSDREDHYRSPMNTINPLFASGVQAPPIAPSLSASTRSTNHSAASR